MAPSLALLGPQRLAPSLAATADELGIDGPLAIVTAGWQEDEAADEGLREELGRKVVNLELYRRAERLFEEDGELYAIHRRRQDRLQELQRIYRRRLDHALGAYRELLGLSGAGDLLEGERIAALEAVRALDRHHLERVESIHDEHDSDLRGRASISAERAELLEMLQRVEGVAIAGGHVAVLLNRLRLFDLAPALAGKTILAWSAGAMVLAPQIVLFHDSPPWGAGYAEVLDVGLALFDDLLPLPHARRRLRLEDPERVALLARRFAPLLCLGLDQGSRVLRHDAAWRVEEVRHLDPGGTADTLGRSALQELRS